MSDDEFSFEGGLFEEPEDFAPPPTPAHFAKYDRKHSPQDGTPSQITLRLVGNSPLWGHLLWNAGSLAKTINVHVSKVNYQET